MHRHRIRITIASVIFSLLASASVHGQDNQRCFPETSQCIGGRVRQFWEENGGLPVFGLPITPQRQEMVEGKLLQTQWFERNRLELHPENTRLYDVLLGRLGAERLAQQGRDRLPLSPTSQRDGCRFFPETRHNVCGEILAAWRTHGLEFDGQDGTSERENLALFGLPLSNEMTETVQGRSYRVQWFERARFELHPENQPPYNVLLGLLGSELRASVAPPVAPASANAVLVGAGDIASCDSAGDEATAELLDGISGTVFTVGDNAYDSGADAEFASCYGPSWGRHKARTRPAAGNHDYATAGASGYFSYFGAAAGDADKGYYSYNLGMWHIIVVNSNCWAVGGCQAGSPQERWLRADLAAHPATCALAYWHHPRFSSGAVHGSSAEMQSIWQALYDAHADVVISGHDHVYERFAPQDPSGQTDERQGIREFVVGTGGRSHYQFGRPIANSQVRNADTFGVLKLTLHVTSYDWHFIPQAGKTFADSGSADCH